MIVVLLVVAVCASFAMFVIWWTERDKATLALAVFFFAVAIHEVLQGQRPGVVVDALIEVAQAVKIVAMTSFTVIEARRRRASRKSKRGQTASEETGGAQTTMEAFR